MAFLEDPRLRQRWNQITQNTEAVTENAAAGIWSFQHNYINPCLGGVASSVEQCTSVCLGDPEERLRRRRERDRMRAEYTFDFYDDWYEDEQNGGLLGSWGGEDWDRILAGTGSSRRHGAETEQPRRKRGMSYGTRGGRRKTNEQDPTIIPSTQPIGFLSKLPWKMGGTLRYKPSAADLQDHPGRHGQGESEPLLGPGNNTSIFAQDLPVTRKRSNTSGSGETSDSFRSRGDLFPSDGEGEEDAVPLDDEITYDMVRKDDRSSGKTRRSSKGKRPADGFASSRTVSRTTLGSFPSRDSLRVDRAPLSQPATPSINKVPSLDDLAMEEASLRLEEDREIARRREAAAQLAVERGLNPESPAMQPKPELEDEQPGELQESHSEEPSDDDVPSDGNGDDSMRPEAKETTAAGLSSDAGFVPARLPNFG
ncbi:hypothetical protein B0I35DRAFT_478755 [Stachybotrys elegans]|uniref:Uncharacterized protein n=1 Tax=Stachybotrys elegans TaxID=80388 RepID=A0A8K0SPM8_9HYPO|nr:hypothetical protein B0I35DRAFT_478755 [Stachybotrys elegans]